MAKRIGDLQNKGDGLQDSNNFAIDDGVQSYRLSAQQVFDYVNDKGSLTNRLMRDGTNATSEAIDTMDGAKKDFTNTEMIRFIIEKSTMALMPNWYIKYNDGWIEQGGIVLAGNQLSGTVFSLLLPFRDTNFSVIITPRNGGRPNAGEANNAVLPESANSFRLASGMGTNPCNFMWEAKGY